MIKRSGKIQLPERLIPSKKSLELLERVPGELFSIPGHAHAIQMFSRHANFRGNSVLEIGGALKQNLVYDYLMVNKWVSVNLYSWRDRSVPDHVVPLNEVSAGKIDESRYLLVNGSADAMSTSFAEKFDIACSINAFEHIHNIWKTLEAIYLSLKPGGVLIAIFGPIWPSRIGHHVWLNADMNFTNMDKIPPYIHLKYTKTQCRKLVSREYGEETGDRFIRDAFFDLGINRLFVEDYIEAIEESSFSNWELNAWGIEKNKDTLAVLTRLHGDRVFADGLNLVAQK